MNAFWKGFMSILTTNPFGPDKSYDEAFKEGRMENRYRNIRERHRKVRERVFRNFNSDLPGSFLDPYTPDNNPTSSTHVKTVVIDFPLIGKGEKDFRNLQERLNQEFSIPFEAMTYNKCQNKLILELEYFQGQ